MLTHPTLESWRTFLGIVLALAVVGIGIFRYCLHLAYRRLMMAQSKLKSAEVRHGLNSETIAPFLRDFPVDIKKPGTTTIFVGQPVDYIHFDPETGVTFIEVKSGNAALSPKQRTIKQHIQAGRVDWREVRIGNAKKTASR